VCGRNDIHQEDDEAEGRLAAALLLAYRIEPCAFDDFGTLADVIRSILPSLASDTLVMSAIQKTLPAFDPKTALFEDIHIRQLLSKGRIPHPDTTVEDVISAYDKVWVLAMCGPEGLCVDGTDIQAQPTTAGGVSPSGSQVNRLTNMRIATVADPMGKSKHDLHCLKGIGRGTLGSLEATLSSQDPSSLEEPSKAGMPDAHGHANGVEATVLQQADKKTKSGVPGIPEDALTVRLKSMSVLDAILHGSASVDQVIRDAKGIELSEVPTLYECIPTALSRSHHFRDKAIDTLLKQPLDHCLLVFGYARARDLYRELFAVLTTSSPGTNLTEPFVRTVRKGMPKALLRCWSGWFHFSPNLDIPANATVKDLVSDDSDIVSAYVAYSIICSLQGLLIDYQAPVSLKELFSRCIRDVDTKCSQRDIDIITRHLGIGTQPEPISSIAREYGRDRGRISQIVKSFEKEFDVTKSYRLLPLRLALMAEAVRLGGKGEISDLEKALTKARTVARNKELAGVLSLLPEYEVDTKSGTFCLADHPCLSCLPAQRAMQSLASGQGTLPINSLMSAIGCKACPHHLPPRLENIPLDPRLSSTDAVVGPKDDPKIAIANAPRSARARVHAIITFSQQAMSADEVSQAYEKAFHESISKARVISYLGSFDDLMLWGRGTYIHVKHAPFPRDLVSEVAKDCLRLFSANRTPILGVGGIYQRHQEELSSHGVPTRHALYSLLRLLKHDGLLLREYPWICDEERIGDRTTFAKYLSSIIGSQGGYISDEEAEDIAQRAMTQEFQLGRLREHKNSLVHADGGICDLNMIEIDYERLDEFVCEIAEQMEEGEQVSARTVFDNNRPLLVPMGIGSYELLYHIVRLREDHLPLSVDRIPGLIKTGKDISA